VTLNDRGSIFPTEGVGTASLCCASVAFTGLRCYEPLPFSRLKESGLLRCAAQRLRRQRQLNDRGSIFPTEKVGTASLCCAAVAFTGLRCSEPLSFSRLKKSGLLRCAAQRLRRQRQLNDRGSISIRLRCAAATQSPECISYLCGRKPIMAVEIIVPSPAESIREVTLSNWLRIECG